MALTQTDPLIEELESSIVDGWVRTPYFDWKLNGPEDHLRLNFRYQSCLRSIAHAKAATDWRTYIALHLPQYREDAFFGIQELENIPHPLHNQLVGEIWTDPGILHSGSCFIMASMRSDAPHDTNDLMTTQELAALNSLPTIVTAFRSHLDWNQLGPCWTLNEKVAEQFAATYDWEVLTTVRVPREYIMAYFDRREEAELVIRDHSKSEIVSERKIK